MGCQGTWDPGSHARACCCRRFWQAVALGQTVYLWNAHTGQIQQLTQTTAPEDYVSSLNFSQDGQHIAVGTNSNVVSVAEALDGCAALRLLLSVDGEPLGPRE